MDSTMGIPKKALKESQLKYLTAGSAVNDGSHQIFKVTFIEKGIEKNAFFKKIAPAHHYPELLALISVATSVFKRSFQGQNSAEERLVFDEKDKLVGTLSIAIEGFKPLNFADEEVATEPYARELVIPSTKSLIEKNVMEILLGRYFLDDDDTHPHNLGFAGNHAADIDFDMFWYWFTIYMKEPRAVIGVPKRRISLTIRDWESFPNTKDAKHYHWPTYTYPGQVTLPNVMPVQGSILPHFLPKTYADPIQFQLLANSAQAQEQKLAAALKILVTYQPSVIRERLYEQFEEIPLNYTSLGPALSSKYEAQFPTLCNKATNVKPFIDFILNLYQEHYDNLYRVAVFYMGSKNNGYGVPLPAMSDALYNKPSLFKNIVEWVKAQNQTLYQSEEITVHYKLEELQNRYHQVWRDAFAPRLRTLLHDSFNLTKKLFEESSIKRNVPSEEKKTTDPTWTRAGELFGTMPNSQRDREEIFTKDNAVRIQGKKATDETLTRAWELFGTMPALEKDEIEKLIAVDKESNLRTALWQLIDFTTKLYAIAKCYYDKECNRLSERDNFKFVSAISKLYSEYNVKIRQNLANTGTDAIEFNSIALGLEQFAKHANFQLHLTTTDEQMKVSASGLPVQSLLHFSSATVLAQFNDALFIWAQTLKGEEFTRLITEIIDVYYTPYLSTLSFRGRSEPVKSYLQASGLESGDNRLAYILSSGNKADGALNTLLIQHLTPHVLLTQHLPSIANAIKSGDFVTHINLFTTAAVEFACSAPRFLHLYHKKGITLFYRTLFEWVDALDLLQFRAILKSSLNDYESAKKWWGSRRAEVEECMKEKVQAKALAMIFLKGEVSSSLNTILFNKIIAAIQADLKIHPEKLAQPGFKLISQYSPAAHKDIYLAEMRACSAAASHQQTAPTRNFSINPGESSFELPRRDRSIQIPLGA